MVTYQKIIFFKKTFFLYISVYKLKNNKIISSDCNFLLKSYKNLKIENLYFPSYCIIKQNKCDR